MKTLIAFYSYTGNTKQIANYIKSKIDADITEIVPATPYSDDYDLVVENAKAEIKNNYTPEILPLNVELNDYDTIIIGTPVWWYTFAPAIRTFLSSNNFDNKNIFVFATNGGWIGHTFDDIEKLLDNSKLINTIDIKFSGDRLQTPNKNIDEFINSIR